MKLPPSKLAAAFVLAAVALSLGSCGRRGALEPPPGAPASTVPLTGTPDEETSQYPGEPAGQNTANSGTQATPAQAGAKPAVPHVAQTLPARSSALSLHASFHDQERRHARRGCRSRQARGGGGHALLLLFDRDARPSLRSVRFGLRHHAASDLLRGESQFQPGCS